MKIQSNTPISYNTYSKNILRNTEGENLAAVESQEQLAPASKIPFTGMNKLVPKRLDIESETRKLLKQIL